MAKKELSQVVIRLDEPCNPSTRLGERVELRGWLNMPAGYSPDDFELKVLLECGSAPSFGRDYSQILGTVATQQEPDDSWFLERLQLLPRTAEKRVGLSAIQFPPGTETYLVSGTLNVAAIVPADGAPSAQIMLTLTASGRGGFSVSNKVEVSLEPRDRWEEPYGGFLFPTSPTLSSDFFIVRGWAVRKGDKLKSVDLLLNGTSIGEAKKGVWSHEIGLSLPDPVESYNCIFAKTLRRKDFAAELDGRLGSKAARFEAICTFESGRELRFSSGGCVWLPASHGWRPGGAIESVSISERGRIVVSGWAVGEPFSGPALFLEGTHRRIHLVNDPAQDISVRWESDSNVECERLLAAQGYGTRFEVKFNPFLLRRIPGRVKLKVRGPNGRLYPVGRDQWPVMERAMAKFAARSGLREVGGNLVFRCASYLGAEHLILPKLRKTKRHGHSIVVASHNLSETEGAPKVLFDVVSALTRAGIGEPVVAAPRDGGLRKQYEALGIDVFIIPEFEIVGQSWNRYFKAMARLHEVLGNEQPEMVISNVVDAFWGVDYAKRICCPSLWIIHESVNALKLFDEIDPKLKLLFLNRLYQTERVVFVARKTEELFRPVLQPGSSVVIPNGLRLDPIEKQLRDLSKQAARDQLGIPPNTLAIVSVGTTTHRKGQDILLRELARLKDSARDPFRCLIVGAREGEYLDSLHALAAELGLGDLVSFIPEKKDVAPYYIAADVMVIASREESAPLVSLEAFGYERPLVSTAVFGLAEQLRHGENSLVFDPEKPGDLCDKITRIAHDPELGWRLVETAKADLVRRFSYDRAMSAYVAEVRKLLSSKGRQLRRNWLAA